MVKLRKDKETFVKETTKRAKNLRKMRAIIEDFVVPSIRRFDGRALNKKICDHIKEVANDPNIEASISTDFWGKKQLEVRLFTKPGNYSDYFNFVIELKSMYIDGSTTARIDANSTIDIPAFIKRLNYFSEDAKLCDDAVERFDEYLEMADRMQEQINAWRKVNQQFRCNVRFYTPYGLT